MLKKIMVLVLSVIVGGAFLVGCGSSKTVTDESKAKPEKTIIVGTSPDYYPWCYTENGNLQGFEIDVWNEIAKRADYKLEFKQSKFAGLFGMLDSSQIDTVAHQISTTPERMQKYNFTETYAYSGYSFVVKKDSNFSKIEDFKGKKIGCTLGGNGEKTLKTMNDEKKLDLTIVTYDQTPMEKEVEIGRLDAAWIGTVKAKTVIEKEKMNLKLYDPKYVYETNQYPFRKDEANKQKIEDLNKAIKAMHADGTFTKISIKWFGLDTTKN